ncbi:MULTISPECIES: hypothetical protein [Saliphagus]|uniref:DUF8006 domain-containing protein n=1 Tax=Saliphagus infecundisoli TaxID=1849069 RepID=A0ABD5QJV4_9EURY|nr:MULTISPECIES: hypothetical protein [Saliphagus]
MLELPLQAIDNVLRQFNVGQIILGVFLLSILGVLPLKSMKVVGLVLITFGAVFLLLPTSLAGGSMLFRIAGVGLVVVGPMMYAVAES